MTLGKLKEILPERTGKIKVLYFDGGTECSYIFDNYSLFIKENFEFLNDFKVSTIVFDKFTTHIILEFNNIGGI